MWVQVKLKLTNREKKLLIVLGICLAVALVYYAVVKPQFDMVGRLQKQAEEYSIKIQRAKEKVNPANPTYKEYNELYDNTQALLKTFYPSIIQEKIILMLQDKLDAAKLNIKEMTFTEPALAEMQPPKAEQLSQVKQTDELQALTEQLNNVMKSVPNTKTGKAATDKNPLSLEKMTVTTAFCFHCSYKPSHIDKFLFILY
jgi:type IV pilus assembly protein PilO